MKIYRVFKNLISRLIESIDKEKDGKRKSQSQKQTG